MTIFRTCFHPYIWLFIMRLVIKVAHNLGCKGASARFKGMGAKVWSLICTPKTFMHPKIIPILRHNYDNSNLLWPHIYDTHVDEVMTWCLCGTNISFNNALGMCFPTWEPMSSHGNIHHSHMKTWIGFLPWITYQMHFLMDMWCICLISKFYYWFGGSIKGLAKRFMINWILLNK